MSATGRLVPAVAFVGAWTVVILLFALQLRYANGLRWDDALARATLDRGPWALLSPFIIGLAWWAQGQRLSAWRTIGLHACAMLAALLLAESLVQGVFLKYFFPVRIAAPLPLERVDGRPPAGVVEPERPAPRDGPPPRRWDGSDRPPRWDAPDRPPRWDAPDRPPRWDAPDRPPRGDEPDRPPRRRPPPDLKEGLRPPQDRQGALPDPPVMRLVRAEIPAWQTQAGRAADPYLRRVAAAPEKAAGGRASPPAGADDLPFPPEFAPDAPRWWVFTMIALRKGYNGVPLYLLIAALSHAYLFWRNLRERESRVTELEARLLMARADMLRLQLEPHFLFNTLNAIGTVVYRDAALADDLIGRLSTLLRRLLELRDENTISIERELETVRAYVGIEQARFGDRLRFEEDIAPEAREFPIPVLLLQPLAENAVRHGIEPLGRTGTLRIAAAMRGGMLDILVEDDGVGMPRQPDTAAGADRSGFGIGLASARLRLTALYGGAARVEAHPRLGGGTRIEIRVPKKPAPRMQESTS